MIRTVRSLALSAALATGALFTAGPARAQEQPQAAARPAAKGSALTLEAINTATLEGDPVVVDRPCAPAVAAADPDVAEVTPAPAAAGEPDALASDIENFLDGNGSADTASETGDSIVTEPQAGGTQGDPALAEAAPANCAAPSSAPAEPQMSGKKATALVARVQVALDRAGVSNGVIDGLDGENFRKAVRIFEQVNNLDVDGKLDHATIELLFGVFGENAMVEYAITEADVAGPFIASVPEDYGKKAKLESLAYTSVTEMLAERFHMDEKFLKRLNGDAAWTAPGTVIMVAQPKEPIEAGSVSRIVIDGKAGSLIGYDAEGNFKVYYPATIGSSDTPSPSGTHTVERIAPNPGYTYNPKINFKQGNNKDILHIPPGPNGPVGSMWIALSKPSYGIHGTPEPSKIAKTNSHGCVRLTNWDAAELSKLVHQGTVVEFAGTRDEPAIAEPEVPSGAIEMPTGEEPLAPAAPAQGG
jgi:lipoprotein-anchoring transpeptidase ErfK/SrfK